MNIAFWNIKRNKETYPIITDIINEYGVDIFVIAEIPSNNQWELRNYLPTGYYFQKQNSEVKIEYILNNSIFSEPVTEFDTRSSMIRIKIKNVFINLVGCHLKDPKSYNKEDREYNARKLSKSICVTEKRLENLNTIIIGDFNMNPFEKGMISVEGFNAVMDVKIASRVQRTYDGNEYLYFYNPMWNFLGHFKSINGTIYYNKNEIDIYYWNIFDQALIRPHLLSYFDFDKLKIICKTKKYNLITKKWSHR